MDIHESAEVFELIKSGEWVINIKYTKEGYCIEEKLKKELVKNEDIFTGIKYGSKLIDYLYVCDSPCMSEEPDGTRKFFTPPDHLRCTFLILPGQHFHKVCQNCGFSDYRIALKNLITEKLF
jgi:hypothetical protein